MTMTEALDSVTEAHGRILVVDDNRVNRLTLSQAVVQQGHSVTLAEHGRQALEMLSTETFDIVILDILMPEMDGFEVLERIKADPTLRDTPVIVISAMDDMESVVRCIEMGAEDYLPKPFNAALLRARLSTSLARKRLRDLERAYLRQELALRQNEKLATLGRLSAGLAHELNNPASAALRATKQLRAAVTRLNTANRMLHEALTPAQRQTLAVLEEDAVRRVSSPVDLDALTRADRETEIEEWLEANRVPEPWEAAPPLVNAGYLADELPRMAQSFTVEQQPGFAAWLCATVSIHSLLEEVQTGTARISEVIGALKAYSFMDRAPLQSVDVHKGLNDTLVILRSRLREAAEVRREYASELPPITAWGSELNQVWTNLLDNAADAAASTRDGRIVIRTRPENGGIAVDVEDNGPGIPEDLLPRIFDPFFTTKPPGQGTGLGLAIAHSIVVQKHGGEIAVESQPGATRFTVRLPSEPPATVT